MVPGIVQEFFQKEWVVHELVQLRLAVELVVILRIKVIDQVVISFGLEMLYHAEQAIWHKEAVGQDQVLRLASLYNLGAPAQVMLAHLFSLLFLDMVLVEDLLCLKIDYTFIRVSHQEVAI